MRTATSASAGNGAARCRPTYRNGLTNEAELIEFPVSLPVSPTWPGIIARSVHLAPGNIKRSSGE